MKTSENFKREELICHETVLISEGIPIRKETYSISYDKIYEASLKSVKQLGWKLVSNNIETGEVKAQTEATLRSWGENITINLIKEEEEVTTISISSEPEFQRFDWRKSEENERAFHKALEKIILR